MEEFKESSKACKKGKLMVMRTIYKAICTTMEESTDPEHDVIDMLQGVASLTISMSLDVENDGPTKIANALGIVVSLAKHDLELEELKDGD